LERFEEASVLSLKEKNSFLFSASSSPKELTGYVFLCVVKESSINQFQVQAYIRVRERINNAKKGIISLSSLHELISVWTFILWLVALSNINIC
jgi:hypothetical protein